MICSALFPERNCIRIEKTIYKHSPNYMETKIARTREELDKVFQLRYMVYVEEEGKFGGVYFPGKRIRDEFDDDEQTINLLMLQEGEAIGTVRVSSADDEHKKLPPDKLYDFSTVRKEHKGFKPASIGMLVVRRSYQTREIFNALMISVGKALLQTSCGYYIFTLNHECSRLMCRSFGAKKLTEKFWSNEVGNFIIPMILYKEQALKFIIAQNNRSSLRKNNLIIA